MILGLLLGCAPEADDSGDELLVDVAPQSFSLEMNTDDFDCVATPSNWDGFRLGTVELTSHEVAGLEVVASETVSLPPPTTWEGWEHSFLRATWTGDVAAVLVPGDVMSLDLDVVWNCTNKESIPFGVHDSPLEIVIDGEPFAIDVTVDYEPAE